MNNTEKKLLSDVLDIIEQKETGLLVWGIVDGMFTEYELSDLINPVIDDAIENGLHPISLVDTDEKVIIPDTKFIRQDRLPLSTDILAKSLV